MSSKAERQKAHKDRVNGRKNKLTREERIAIAEQHRIRLGVPDGVTFHCWVSKDGTDYIGFYTMPDGTQKQVGSDNG